MFMYVDWPYLYTLIGHVYVHWLAVFMCVDWPCLYMVIGRVYVFIYLHFLYSLPFQERRFRSVLVHRRLIHWLPCSRFCLCFDVSFETLELTCPNFVNGGQQKWRFWPHAIIRRSSMNKTALSTSVCGVVSPLKCHSNFLSHEVLSPTVITQFWFSATLICIMRYFT